MSVFIFEDYSFDIETDTANFEYSFDGNERFCEKVVFGKSEMNYDKAVLDRALFLAFLVVGVSYYKTKPTPDVRVEKGEIDDWQVRFFNKVYQEGLGQFAFENNLQREQLANFKANLTEHESAPKGYSGEGILLLQSGGKDSLLTAQLLKKSNQEFTPWYVSSSDSHPKILDDLGSDKLSIARRFIDHDALRRGGLNGHVPVTYIVQSFALIQAVLLGKNKVLASIGHEGEEPHAYIGDLLVTHQWSKSWEAEQLFSEYVNKYISPGITVGSPLRRYSELRIAEMFVENAWEKYSQKFSSCNRSNYTQEHQNVELSWCGECPKCVNSYLLFSPFVSHKELKTIFNGVDLYQQEGLQETFKGLLGVGGTMKPFECIGEVEELRLAYKMSQRDGGYGRVLFTVPDSDYKYKDEYQSQEYLVLPAN